MFEFHGWFALRDSTHELDEQAMWGVVARLRARVRRLGWESSASAEVRAINGTYFLFVHGNLNRRGVYGPELDDLLVSVASEAPGSYGLLYWRDDEDDPPAGSNNYQVTVMARGSLTLRLDPFLSPTVPTVEDAWEPGME